MKTTHSSCWIAILVLLLTVGSSGTARSADFEFESKLVASDSAPNSAFGDSVSVEGGLALIGASNDGLSGAAYVYRFGTTDWVEEQKLVSSDLAQFDIFGRSVSLSGDVALVGADGDETLTGAAYVFRYDGSTWVEEQKLTASDGAQFDRFGASVAVDGDVAFICAPNADLGGSIQGAIYVFRFDGSTWIQEQKLSGSARASGDAFGRGVAFDGQTALVGAPGDGGGAGAVYAFQYDGSSWVEDAKITLAGGTTSDGFGVSVAVDGDHALIGADGVDILTGRAYVFRNDGSSWDLDTTLAAGDGAEFDFFGISVDLKGDLALVGASGDEDSIGSAYVFRHDGSGWTEESKLTADDGDINYQFGNAVAIADELALVGAVNDAGSRGAAYTFFNARCLPGTVDITSGTPADVLFINGLDGGQDRTVQFSEADLRRIVVTVQMPPSGGNGKFVLHAHAGLPSVATQTILPFDVGTSCFSFLLPQGAMPVVIANNIGKTNQVGESEFFGSPTDDPDRATTSFAYDALPAGTVLTWQAIMIDPASESSKSASVTNAVILEVLP